MRYVKIKNCLEQLVKRYGTSLIPMIENNEEDIIEEVMQSVLETVKEIEKPKEINTIQDLAKLLDGNIYCAELKNPYDINVAELCKKNKWVVLFPYSDDNLEVRGYIDDEIGAYGGIHTLIYRKGDFYPVDLEEKTFKKATEDFICGIDDTSVFEAQVEDGCIGIDVRRCPDKQPYTWYMTSKFKNVAYFDIVYDDDIDATTFARCCIVDLSI